MQRNFNTLRYRGQRSCYPPRGFPSYRQKPMNEKSIEARPPSPPLGPVFKLLTRDNIVDSDRDGAAHDKLATISDCVDVGSFNWLDRDEPTILVPGMPPAWTPPSESRQLEQDAGNYFRDPNAARFSHRPMEPSVRTLLTVQESLETQNIDLFACSSTLGNLLRFILEIDKPFRFFVEVVGKTVFFIRHENSPTETLKDVRGYGHTFPEAYTTWSSDVKGSASHQRLLQYEFEGLKCIMRFECDGYFRSQNLTASLASTEQKGFETEDDISFDLGEAKVSPSAPLVASHQFPLKIREAGQKVLQKAVFELKTRAEWKKDTDMIEEQMPRLWVAQIPNLILAYHKRGIFNDIKIRNVGNEVKDWEQRHQVELRRFGKLLCAIIAAAKARKDRKMEVRCKDLEQIELREQDSEEHNVLSPALSDRWKKGCPPIQPKSTENASDAIPAQDLLRSDQEDAYSPVASNTSYSGQGYHSDSKKECSEPDSDDLDFTACSADACGYCGHCSYCSK